MTSTAPKAGPGPGDAAGGASAHAEANRDWVVALLVVAAGLVPAVATIIVVRHRPGSGGADGGSESP